MKISNFAYSLLPTLKSLTLITAIAISSSGKTKWAQSLKLSTQSPEKASELCISGPNLLESPLIMRERARTTVAGTTMSRNASSPKKKPC